MVDLGYLYGFIQELESLCVSGVASRSSPCQELISNQAFDISLFKSLQKLQVRRFFGGDETEFSNGEFFHFLLGNWNFFNSSRE